MLADLVASHRGNEGFQHDHGMEIVPLLELSGGF